MEWPPGEADLVAVECRCGRRYDCTKGELYRKASTKSRACAGCRDKVYEVKARCVGCGAPLRRATRLVTRAKCPSCARAVVAKCGRASRKRVRNATRGRVCCGCGKHDSDAPWSGNVRLCEACARAGVRNGTAPCGAPLFKGRAHGTPRCRRHGEEGCK